MIRKKRTLSLSMIFFLLFSFITPFHAVKAETQAVSATKSVSSEAITVNDEVEVKLDIKGTPPVNVIQPNDVMLIIDKSGSMGGDKIASARDAAKGFVDLMDLTKHRVGIADFSYTVNTLPLTTDAQSAKNYVDGISAGGNTDTGAAIRAAKQQLANHRPEAQPVIVILTDGQANNTADALAAAKEAKDAGIVFYTVALLNTDENPDTSAPNLLLRDMATTASHHHFVLGSTGLPEIYAGIVKEIGIASAKDVVVTDTVSPEFEIVPGSYDSNIPKPTVSGNTLTWNFLELKEQTLSFTYKIRPKSKDVAGEFTASTGSTIQYKDYQGNAQTCNIASPKIKVSFLKPDITGVTPDKSEITGGNEITITGTNFKQGAKVAVNSTEATNIQVASETEIKATMPAGVQGDAVIRVTNPDGQYDEENHHYYANPAVTSISPAKGYTQGGDIVSIYGANFMPGVKVFFNNVEAATTYSNSRYITAKTPKSAVEGAVDVKVVNPDASETVVSNGFTYENLPAPTITSLSQNEGQLAGGDYVYIYGTNFMPGATVKVGDKAAAKIILVEPTRIRIVVPQGANPGAVKVEVTNPDGQSAALDNGYTYLEDKLPAPSIRSLSKTSGLVTGGDYVTVFALDLQQGLTVTLGGKPAQVINFYDATQIRIIVPEGVEGPAELEITNPDGQKVSLANAYTYMPLPPPPALAVTSLSRTSGLTFGGEYIVITGTGFQKGITAKLGGKDATVLNYYSDTSIRIIAPSSTSEGAVDLELTNPDGKTISLKDAYTYSAPVMSLSSLSTSTGEYAGGYYIFIYGSNFDPNAAVTINDVPVAVTRYGNYQIKINSMPSSEALGLPVAGGAVTIKVTDPFGKSVSANFTYKAKPAVPVAQITKMCGAGGYPPAGSISGGTYLYFYGTGFTSTMKVRIYDASNNLVKEEAIYNYFQATYCRHYMPKVDVAGDYTIKLVNSDGIESNGMTYTYK